MRPKNKKHNFSRTDNKKYQEQNHKKEKTNNNTIIVAIFIAFASTIQFSHNTPPHTQHPHRCNPKTHRPQPARYYFTRGDLQNNTRAALDTQQHATKQNKPEHKHTHPCFTDPKPHAHTTTCGTCLHLKTKTLSPLRAQTRHQTMTKTCHHQVLTSTHTVTKQILYSP